VPIEYHAVNISVYNNCVCGVLNRFCIKFQYRNIWYLRDIENMYVIFDLAYTVAYLIVTCFITLSQNFLGELRRLMKRHQD